MPELLAHATIGAALAVAIGLTSRSSVFFLRGLFALFPTFALYAHLQALWPAPLRSRSWPGSA